MSLKDGRAVAVREKPEVSLSRGGRNPILMAIRRLFSLVKEALREIFDESGYHRFLIRGGLQSSAGTYAAFREENEQAKSRKPRCC